MPIDASAAAPEAEPGRPSRPDAPSRESGPLEDLNVLQRELRQLIHDQLRLAALELKLAARSLATAVMAAVCIGLLLILVLTGLMAAAGFGLSDMGLRPAAVMLVLSTIMAVLVLLLSVFLRRQLGNLGFSATLRSLKPAPLEKPLQDAES